MTKIINIQIKNYRGIKELKINFDARSDLICFIGRGDSGKSTILEAISSVLSHSWNLTFHDTDFYNCNPENPIEIIASLINFPDKLLSDTKFGLYLRAFNPQTGEIFDDITDETIEEISEPVITIKLLIDKTLEPQWTVINSRQSQDKQISGADRALLNCYMISDYLDRHFSWNKGNPLYALLKSVEDGEVATENNVVIEALREVKNTLDQYKFEELKNVTNLVKEEAASFGLNISNMRTTLDVKELAIRDGRVSLHEEAIPFRLKGKGSKRLASLAIQSTLVSNGGIMLVDEIEQGLEPDRAKQLVRSLKSNKRGQIFLTTHSREVITELEVKDLALVIRDKYDARMEVRQLENEEGNLQAAIRVCSEAFFAHKVIVCEGKTELGICRSLDKYRKSQGLPLMAFQNCAYVLGAGDSIIPYTQGINSAKFQTLLFCDSDKENINQKKENLRVQGVTIIDCEDQKDIEAQIFNDLPWNAVKELIAYALEFHKKGDLNALNQSISQKYPQGVEYPDNALETDSMALRCALAKVAIVEKKEWFKRIDHGEMLGDIIFKYYDEINDQAHLKTMLSSFSNWIDANGS